MVFESVQLDIKLATLLISRKRNKKMKQRNTRIRSIEKEANMGKLSIIGSAEKDYEYDLMEIKVIFNSSAVTTKEAVKKVSEQCEE